MYELNCTGIGRKNKTEFNILTTLKKVMDISNLVFNCVYLRKLFTIVNMLAYCKIDLGCPQIILNTTSYYGYGYGYPFHSFRPL